VLDFADKDAGEKLAVPDGFVTESVGGVPLKNLDFEVIPRDTFQQSQIVPFTKLESGDGILSGRNFYTAVPVAA
jgi:hypothetical protein